MVIDGGRERVHSISGSATKSAMAGNKENSPDETVSVTGVVAHIQCTLNEVGRNSKASRERACKQVLSILELPGYDSLKTRDYFPKCHR